MVPQKTLDRRLAKVTDEISRSRFSLLARELQHFHPISEPVADSTLVLIGQADDSKTPGLV